MEAVLKGFGTSTGKADPVVHFYETFLKEYDPKPEKCAAFTIPHSL
jgi:hypothetical protein